MEKRQSKWKPWHRWAIIACIILIIVISLIPRKSADTDTVVPVTNADSMVKK